MSQIETKTLASLVEHSSQLFSKIIASEGELSPELEAELQSVLSTDLPAKVDACQYFLSRLESEIEYFSAQAKQLQDATRSLKNAESRFKDYIKQVMLQNGLTDIEGNTYRFKLSNSKPSLVVNQELVEPAYKVQIVETVVDKKKIEDDLKLGVPVIGAELVPSYSLRSYANKKVDR